jgi:flagellar protein FliO/FliZ
MNDFWTTFFYIAVMVAVLVGAYLTTKFLSGKTKKMQKGRFISLTERLPLGKDKNIALIEVAGQNYLIGITNQSINILGQIDGENLKAVKEAKSLNPRKGFVEQFRSFITNAKDAQENLRKARAQYGQAKSSKYDQDDILKQMDNAIRQRRDRMESGNGDDEE